jgi:hypothetical protein
MQGIAFSWLPRCGKLRKEGNHFPREACFYIVRMRPYAARMKSGSLEIAQFAYQVRGHDGVSRLVICLTRELPSLMKAARSVHTRNMPNDLLWRLRKRRM